MDNPPTPIVYYVSGQVELKQWVSESKPDRVENYPQAGLIFVSSQMKQGRSIRTIQEYVSSEEFLKTVRLEDAVERSKLQSEHEKTLADRVIDFGLPVPVELDSDLANTDPAMPLMESRPAVAYHLLYLPTLVPQKPDEPVDEGKDWVGSIRLMCKGSEFPVTYHATLVHERNLQRTIQITIDQQEPVAKTEMVTGWLKPSGQWTVVLSSEDGTQISSEGEISFTFRMKYYNMDGRLLDIEALSCRNQFKIERVPISVEATKIFPKAWGEHIRLSKLADTDQPKDGSDSP